LIIPFQLLQPANWTAMGREVQEWWTSLCGYSKTFRTWKWRPEADKDIYYLSDSCKL